MPSSLHVFVSLVPRSLQLSQPGGPYEVGIVCHWNKVCYISACEYARETTQIACAPDEPGVLADSLPQPKTESIGVVVTLSTRCAYQCAILYAYSPVLGSKPTSGLLSLIVAM